MGDDSSFRYRRDDGYASQPTGVRSPQAQPDTQSAEDALAELARLIGDEDPFADFADMTEEPEPAPARPVRETPTRPQFSALPVERRFEDWQPGRRSAREAAPEPDEAPPVRESTGFRQPSAFAASPAAGFPARPPMPQAPAPSGRDSAFPPRESTALGGLRARAPEPAGWAGSEATNWGAAEAANPQAESRSTVRLGYGSLARRNEGAGAEQARGPAQQQEYDDYDAERDEGREEGAYAYSDTEQTRYAEYDDTYDPAFDEEGYMPPHGEEVYETEPRRNRGRMALIAVAALVGVGVVATAGVMVFRGGGSGSSSTAETAPVIKADTSPSKVAGPSPANGQGAEGQKLIYDRVGGQPGQEKVVPREEQPMDVNAAAAAAAAAGAAQQPASPTDPKRVRTVAVRADGSIVPGVPAASAAAPAGGVAPTAYAPTQNPIPTGAPAPKTVAVVPTTGTGVPVAAAPASAVAPAPAAPAPTPASVPAAAPPAASATGNYVVQVSSQKSEADALGSFKVLQTRYPQLLGSYKASVQRADLGDKGIFYRALVGPFATRDDATNLCTALQAQGGTCFVTRR